LLEILDDLSQKGKTVVIATHDVDLAAEWANRIVVIQNGKVLAEGDKSILIDPIVIEQADLEFPTVTKIFLEFPSHERERFPMTIKEAITRIKRMSNYYR